MTVSQFPNEAFVDEKKRKARVEAGKRPTETPALSAVIKQQTVSTDGTSSYFFDLQPGPSFGSVFSVIWPPEPLRAEQRSLFN